MDPVEPPEALRVLVIGAGSAGLLMAQVLQKVGIEVTVFEQDRNAYVRPRDWNLGVYWAQSRIEECLTPELNALINTVQTDPSYRRWEGSVLPIYNGMTGEPLKVLPAPDAMRLRRKAWLNLLRTGVDVRYGKKLTSISTTDSGVTVTFEDGTVENGSLLIGAEGAHSVTRNWLFQSSPEDAAMRELPLSAFGTLTKLGRDLALAIRKIYPTYIMTLDPKGVFTFVSVHDCTPEDPADWTFMLLVSWPTEEGQDHAALSADNDRLLDEMHARAEPLAYPYRNMLQEIPRETKGWYSGSLKYWPTKPWDSWGGRVTLAGDAAHTMTYHRGQGLGNAIADAAELQTQLRAMKARTREELAKAVGEYEKEVWKRGYKVVMQNTENSLSVHNWEKVKESELIVTGVNNDPSRS